MLTIFISQPMFQKSKEEIDYTQQCAIEKLHKIFPYDFLTILDTYIKDDLQENYSGLRYLARSIELLDKADYAVFLEGWEDGRGCRIEHECAKAYGVPIIYLQKEE